MDWGMGGQGVGEAGWIRGGEYERRRYVRGEEKGGHGATIPPLTAGNLCVV